MSHKDQETDRLPKNQTDMETNCLLKSPADRETGCLLQNSTDMETSCLLKSHIDMETNCLLRVLCVYCELLAIWLAVVVYCVLVIHVTFTILEREKYLHVYVYEESTMTKFKYVGQPRTQVDFQ